MKTITAYRCDHCGRVFVTKKACVVHESNCIKNRDNRACPTCVYDSSMLCMAKRKPEGVNLIKNCLGWYDIDNADDLTVVK